MVAKAPLVVAKALVVMCVCVHMCVHACVLSVCVYVCVYCPCVCTCMHVYMCVCCVIHRRLVLMKPMANLLEINSSDDDPEDDTEFLSHSD